MLLIFIEIFPEKIVQFFTDFPLFGITIFWKMTRITPHLARKSAIPMISHKQVSPWRPSGKIWKLSDKKTDNFPDSYRRCVTNCRCNIAETAFNTEILINPINENGMLPYFKKFEYPLRKLSAYRFYRKVLQISFLCRLYHGFALH